MIRRFELVNGRGFSLDLNNGGVLGFEPDGLGFERETEYIQSGVAFIPIKSEISQGELNLRMIIGLNIEFPYKTFKDFGDFVTRSPLKLIYETDAGLFERLCVLSAMSKSEVKHGFAFDESMTLEFITPWYRLAKEQTSSTEQRFAAGLYGKIYAGIGPEVQPSENLIEDPQLTTLEAVESIDETRVRIIMLD